MYVSSIPENTKYDVVIVGAGPAGCVLANRLSANGCYQILLIEAGGRDDTLSRTSLNIHIPLLVANLLRDERVTWPFVTEPQVHQNGQQHLCAMGKVLGGSGSINGNLFVRGDPKEYDSWHNDGCPGWSYADLLPYFKQLEDFPPGDPESRGHGGPIGVTRLEEFDELSDAFIEAAHESGYRKVSDYNDGKNYEGASYMQLSTRNGLRSSASIAYLRPVRNRKNLTVLTGATVTRVLIEDKRASGVEFFQKGQLVKAYAHRETILSAGPIQSPKLLELSGVGNRDILSKHNIEVVHHLPGVGENLRDQGSLRMTFECSKPITVNDVQNSPWKKLREALKFLFKREGFLSISTTTARIVLRSDPKLTQPDLNLRLNLRSGKDRYARTPRYGSDRYSGFSIGIAVIKPCSTGTVHIGSNNPHQQVTIDPNYLSDEADGKLFIKGMRIARQISQAPSLKSLIVAETRPGMEIQEDRDFLEYIRANVATSWHMVGTCKMGIDPMAVVDPQLRVRGITNLRVIDSSVLPTIPSTNTNVPTLAAAEKGAAMMLAALSS